MDTIGHEYQENYLTTKHTKNTKEMAEESKNHE